MIKKRSDGYWEATCCHGGMLVFHTKKDCQTAKDKICCQCFGNPPTGHVWKFRNEIQACSEHHQHHQRNIYIAECELCGKMNKFLGSYDPQNHVEHVTLTDNLIRAFDKTGVCSGKRHDL